MKMKKMALFVVALFGLACQAEEYKWKGLTLKGKVVSATPATVKIALPDGSVRTCNIHDLSLDSAAKIDQLPNNPYAEELAEKQRTEEALAISKKAMAIATALIDCAQKTSDYVYDEMKKGKLTPEQAEAIMSKIIPKKIAAVVKDYRTTCGVPDSVYRAIKANAEKAWPEDYRMQKFETESQIESYKAIK